jgi:Domain of unknown function (DUF4124)
MALAQCELRRISRNTRLDRAGPSDQNERMKRRYGALMLLACATVAAQADVPQSRPSRLGAGSAGGVLYKWTDDKGVVHYGDHVPPDAAQGNTAVLNTQGVPVRELPARLTSAQQEEVQRRDETVAKQKQHDRFLLSTYTSVRDIEQLRDERLGQIDGQINAARGYIESVDQRMTTLRMRAGTFKPYSEVARARRMPDALAAELVQTLNEGRSQREILATKQQEERHLRESFQADIDRYRELNGK